MQCLLNDLNYLIIFSLSDMFLKEANTKRLTNFILRGISDNESNKELLKDLFWLSAHLISANYETVYLF